LRVDLRPDVLDAAEVLPAGLPRFFSVVDLPLSATGVFFLRPVELLARGVFTLGVRLAGEVFLEDERPFLDLGTSSSYYSSSISGS